MPCGFLFHSIYAFILVYAPFLLSWHLRHLAYFFCDSIGIFKYVYHITSLTTSTDLLKFDEQKHFSDIWLLTSLVPGYSKCYTYFKMAESNQSLSDDSFGPNKDVKRSGNMMDLLENSANDYRVSLEAMKLQQRNQEPSQAYERLRCRRSVKFNFKQVAKLVNCEKKP